MIRVGVVGLGKMGLSHLAVLGAHPSVEVAGVCDSSGYLLGVLDKYTRFQPYEDVATMARAQSLDAVVLATPNHLHHGMVSTALELGLHVFCEKPFTLDPRESDELTSRAEAGGLVGQVGYHNRFVASFREAGRLLAAGAIGRVTHATADAYGPVVLRPRGSTWRSRRAEGGGCLYDYAAHPVNLLNWYLGKPSGVRGSHLTSTFSQHTEDEVLSTLEFDDGPVVQLSVSWSDESQRKMTTRLAFQGTKGRLDVDRQELRLYVGSAADPPRGYQPGWNLRYTTDLTSPEWFYLRGEEYSAQLDAWVRRVEAGQVNGTNDFSSAALTDHTLAAIRTDATGGVTVPEPRRGIGTRTRRPWVPARPALLRGRRAAVTP